MQINKFIRLIFTFYKSFAFVNFLITLACIKIINQFGFNSFTVLFWFKIITLGLVFYFINDRKKEEFYYYKNLGVTKKTLWIVTITFDLILFITLIFLTLKFK